MDPTQWVTDKLGERLWSKQREIAQSLIDNRKTAVHSCHQIGKSFIASRLAAWWIDVHPRGEAFVVTTADTDYQVKGILWREIGRAHRSGQLAGRVNQKDWWINNELVGWGRKGADTDPTAFLGIHARYALVIIDEACGVPKDLWIAANSLIANADSRLLAIGNPDDPASYFREVCKPDSGWNVIGVSAYETPNFTREPIPPGLSEVLISPEFVNDIRREAGEGSPYWFSKILGQFPENAEDSVVLLSCALACHKKENWIVGSPNAAGTIVEPNPDSPNTLGVDVGAGGDQSVIYQRKGRKARLVARKQTPDTMELVGMVMRAIEHTGASVVNVDATGIGQGVVDRLRELGKEGRHRARVERVMVGAAPRRKERFPKLRDEIWWEVGRQLSQDRAWDLSDVDEATIAQLTAPKYTTDSSGRIKVEQKAETKKRLGRSPDDADALLLAFYAGSGPTTMSKPVQTLIPRETQIAAQRSRGMELSPVARRLTERQGIRLDR